MKHSREQYLDQVNTKEALELDEADLAPMILSPLSEETTLLEMPFSSPPDPIACCEQTNSYGSVPPKIAAYQGN